MFNPSSEHFGSPRPSLLPLQVLLHRTLPLVGLTSIFPSPRPWSHCKRWATAPLLAPNPHPDAISPSLGTPGWGVSQVSNFCFESGNLKIMNHSRHRNPELPGREEDKISFSTLWSSPWQEEGDNLASHAVTNVNGGRSYLLSFQPRFSLKLNCFPLN